MAPPKSAKESRAIREKMIILKHKFENRISITKFGKAAFDKSDYTTALKRYVEYMEVMAEVKKVKDFYALKPSHFDSKKEITEMLMISHLFFQMARIYDAVPKFKEEAKKCLEQFVTFSANQPYQVVNSEMARKHLKKASFKNADLFRAAYEQIYVQSKKCYIVTFCFGTNHEVTHSCREFKDSLLEHSFGRELVRIYYLYSSSFTQKYENNQTIRLISQYTVKPALIIFSKTILRLILK